MGASISFSDHHYHLKCFKCWLCGTPISLEGSFTKDIFLNPLHSECLRCVQCGSSITENYLLSDGQQICAQDCGVRKNILNLSCPLKKTLNCLYFCCMKVPWYSYFYGPFKNQQDIKDEVCTKCNKTLGIDFRSLSDGSAYHRGYFFN